MLTPREKSPLPENVPRGGSNPRHCGQRAQALPTELFRPPLPGVDIFAIVIISSVIIGFFFSWTIYKMLDEPSATDKQVIST